MNKKTQEKRIIIDQVFDIMESNYRKWNSIDQFKSSYDKFVYNKKKTDELTAIINKDFSAIKNEIQVLKTSILIPLIPCTNLLELYASDLGKKNIQSSINRIHAKPQKLSPKKLIAYVTLITNYAEKRIQRDKENNNLKNKLESYGLTQELINDLKHNTAQYSKMISHLKTEKATVLKAKKKIKTRIKMNEKIIQKRFLKFITLFEKTEPDFYSSFHNSLKISPKDKGKNPQVVPVVNKSVEPATTEKTTPSSPSVKIPTSPDKKKVADKSLSAKNTTEKQKSE